MSTSMWRRRSVSLPGSVVLFKFNLFRSMLIQALALTKPEEVEEDRWFFDPVDRICKILKYRGSGGNGKEAVCQRNTVRDSPSHAPDNNFLTLEECERTCPNIPPCKQAPWVGSGKAAIERWYYDVTEKICKTFIWGGADANDNNFASQARCEATCPPPSPCRLPLDAGDDGCADASSIKWWHNPTTRTCEAFNFTGCGGNRNRCDRASMLSRWFAVLHCAQTCNAAMLQRHTHPAVGLTRTLSVRRLVPRRLPAFSRWILAKCRM